MSDDDDSILWEEEIPRSIFDCQRISKDTLNNTWHCGHCGKTYAIIHATKAVKHLAAIPGVNKGLPWCRQSNRQCLITSQLQRTYNHFYNNIGKKQVANATGKRRTTEALDQLLQAASKSFAERGKKAKGANLKSPPSASSISMTSFRRGGAAAPRLLGSSVSSHFKTTAGAQPVQQVQLKMTDLSPNPSAEQELTVAIAQLIHCCGLPFSLASSELFRRVLTLAKAVPTTHRPPQQKSGCRPPLAVAV